MKKLILIVLAIPFLLIAQNKISKEHQSQALKCSNCHSCDIPTKENPCLIPCPREKMVTITQSAEQSPNILTIDKFKRQTDVYKPVVFTHRLHAEMAGMGGGCKMCHHYNPPGKVAGCSDCHELNRKRADVSKPDLKGAYHRQCMDCHRQWSGKVECESCHAQNKSAKSDDNKKEVKLDAAKKVHPKIDPPAMVKFDTPKASGKVVTFLHNEHVNTFSLDCESCHSNESCNKCHSKVKTASVANRTTTQKHSVCSSCHDTKNDCAKCHNGSKAMGAFNHKERTGFDLNKNHGKLTCIRCHTQKGKFAGLKADCSMCHGQWTKANFKHMVTGLSLDETHADFDCTECHQEKNYTNPTCKNCHDDKTYPKDKPGKMSKKN